MKNKNDFKYIYFLYFFLFFFSYSCANYDDLKETESIGLDSYLEKYPTAQQMPNGWYFLEKVSGTGEKIDNGKDVKIIYTGKYLKNNNGVNFTQDSTLEFVAGSGELLDFWDEGILQMSKGGRAEFIVPSEKGGYAETPTGTVPEFSTLIFDIIITSEDKLVTELSTLGQFIWDNNFEFQNPQNSPYYIETIKGTGKNATQVNPLKVTFIEKTIPDSDTISTAKEPTVFTLGNGTLPEAAEEQIKKMNDGGSAKILLPSTFAYGENGTDKVKPYTPMYYEVEIHSDNPVVQEMTKLSKYILANNIEEKSTESGLYYISYSKGDTTELVADNKQIIIKYNRYELDNVPSLDTALMKKELEFKVGDESIIKGLTEGVKLMAKDGTARLIIPSKLAYGETQTDTISPYTTLIYDVFLKEIKE